MSEILQKAIFDTVNAKHAFCRFITANDTGKNGSHQAGFYIPKCASSILFEVPGIKGENKDKFVEIRWQDSFVTHNRFIYYGQGTRNEYRVTRFGRNFPFFEENNVGDLLILAQQTEHSYTGYVLNSDKDIEDFFVYFNLSPLQTNQLIDISQAYNPDAMLALGLKDIISKYDDFPETKVMAALARKIYNTTHKITDIIVGKNPDHYLLKWIETEYTLFRGFEEKLYQPIYSHPFENCQALIQFSNVILNRRKSRAGKSLENHLATIFDAVKLRYEAQVITEDNKKPDFIFPDGQSYHNMLFPAEKLVFLGAKTTCKDRWRQVLNEADRIDTKYLFTMQQGVSLNQLKEMKHERLKLVVPAGYKQFFDKTFHQEIETLSSFIDIVRAKQR